MPLFTIAVYNHLCLIHIYVCVTVIILRVLAETITKGKLFLSIPAALLKYYVLIQYSKSYCSQLRPNAGPAVNRPYLFLDSRNSLSLLADHDFCFFGGKNKIPSPQRKHVPSTSCRCCNKKIESAYVFFQKRGRSEKLDST